MARIAEDTPNEPSDSSPRRQVLIIEDDTDLAGLLATWLRKHYGDTAEVQATHSVDEASSTLAALPTLDLVLLDRKLPEGTGDALLDTLRDQFDPIVVMVTGVEPQTELIRLPVTDYVVKPVDRAPLLKRLSLLEKLEANGSLSEYTDARKASLLEFHLEDPEADPLFRRFAARWSYDRLEVAATGKDSFVYELYLGGDDPRPGEKKRISVSVIGRLSTDLETLVDRGELEPVGELVPSGESHAWIDVDRSTVVDPPGDGYVIYEFVRGAPEPQLRSADGADIGRIERELEQAFE